MKTRNLQIKTEQGKRMPISQAKRAILSNDEEKNAEVTSGDGRPAMISSTEEKAFESTKYTSNDNLSGE